MMRALDEMAVRRALLGPHPGGCSVSGDLSGLAGAVRSQRGSARGAGPRNLRGNGRVVFRTARECRTWAGTTWSRGAIPSCCADLDARPFVYFAHSYYVPEVDAAAALCTYVVSLHSAARVRNVFGVQFHPEKSGTLGLKIVQNFVNLTDASPSASFRVSMSPAAAS